jgi:hypothetical protein
VWKEPLWKGIYKILPDLNKISDDKKITGTPEIYSIVKGEYIPNAEGHKDEDIYEADFGFKKWKGFKIGRIREIRELRGSCSQELSTLLIDIETDHNDSYQLAQNILVYPKNTLKLVQMAERYLNVDPSDIVIISAGKDELSSIKFKQSFPNRTHIRTILREFIDLNGIPK